MTRILYWNIENFSVNKFWQINRKRTRTGAIAGGLYTNCSQERLEYFRHAMDDAWLNGSPANVARTPDIVVVVELESGVTARGNLVTGMGQQATQQLVNEVRHWTGNANWMAVPPLYTGRTEGVIVLYDSSSLIFTGPDVWPGGAGPAAPPAAPVAAPPAGPAPPSPYPAGWHPYLPARAIPAGARYNANRWENTMSARVAGFTSNGGGLLQPPPAGVPVAGVAIDGNLGPRTPCMVTFFRPASAENITLFAIHAPANTNLARNYMTALACTREVATAPAANERKVIVADLNFNLFANNGAVPQRYQYFTQLGYAIGVAPVPLGAGPPALPLGYFDYFATHLSRKARAVNWSDNTTARPYPGYGYISEKYSCIDNIFVNGGALANTTVLNAIVGSPYAVDPPPPLVAPPWLTPAMRGHFGIDALCPLYNAGAPQWVAPQFVAGMRQTFRSWANFGRIRSTSDHLPLIADF